MISKEYAEVESIWMGKKKSTSSTHSPDTTYESFKWTWIEKQW